MKKLLIAAAAIAAALTSAPTAQASVFHAWEVTDVPWGDVLNVRRWPAAHSQKQSAYPNGTVLSLTGRCKDAPSLIDQIAHLPAWQQRQVVRYRWCEIWHDPAKNGEWQTGWVYMKYMRPD